MAQLRGNTFKRRAVLAALLVSVSLAGCGKSGAPTENKAATANGIEKPNLKLGFIKLTDIAPLVIAKEKGFFAQVGLNVTLEPQANWKVLLDGVVAGDLDSAHMLAGQVLASGAGIGAKTRLITPFSLDINGKAVTVSNQVYQMIAGSVPKGQPVSASVLKPVVESFKAQGKPFKLAMVFPVSTHNYILRYWLAAGGLNPGFYLPGDTAGTTGAQVQLSVTPPPQMPATMEAGTISGYSVGEPWNQAAVAKKIGVPLIVDPDIAGTTGDKVFGMTQAFADKNPKTVQAMLRALIKASMWLDADGGRNRPEAVKLLANSKYVGADEKVLLASMTGKFTFAPGDTRATPEFNQFFANQASYPMYSDGIWYLTQMRRWGQIAQAKPDQWYLDTVKATYRPDLYDQAAKSLVDAGKARAEQFPKTDGFRNQTHKAIDGVPFDAHHPAAYAAGFAIGLKDGQSVTPAGVK
ncbi:nitrate/nitrite transport system substrate-binding protein [Novosphingobium chloroacetimidivorans]|uniref:Nitrate/nitrite transport system substrate-binding protein n=1 Tax=Novosphingobium chloroacetimidivorans TaxID=1428314 RepID=A0A7W7NWV8_9SPHN|nr:CmpA/NrtA family ABC transporter substrate-binding protein [Novosphingobium chloroacetimidivorans]MBB4859988.1 nitrate/nitrite transport system substrate-binding protein [Novosphingobium chloroacetimidivorans]